MEIKVGLQATGQGPSSGQGRRSQLQCCCFCQHCSRWQTGRRLALLVTPHHQCMVLSILQHQGLFSEGAVPPVQHTYTQQQQRHCQHGPANISLHQSRPRLTRSQSRPQPAAGKAANKRHMQENTPQLPVP